MQHSAFTAFVRLCKRREWIIKTKWKRDKTSNCKWEKIQRNCRCWEKSKEPAGRKLLWRKLPGFPVCFHTVAWKLETAPYPENTEYTTEQSHGIAHQHWQWYYTMLPAMLKITHFLYCMWTEQVLAHGTISLAPSLCHRRFYLHIITFRLQCLVIQMCDFSFIQFIEKPKHTFSATFLLMCKWCCTPPVYMCPCMYMYILLVHPNLLKLRVHSHFPVYQTTAQTCYLRAILYVIMSPLSASYLIAEENAALDVCWSSQLKRQMVDTYEKNAQSLYCFTYQDNYNFSYKY